MAQQGPAVYTVNSTADAGVGSFREAIDYADARGGATTIDLRHRHGPADDRRPLAAAGDHRSGDHRRHDAARVFRHALDRAGWCRRGTDPNGLTITGNDITVKGLIISGFSGDGIDVTGNDDLIESSYIGTDATGTQAMGNAGAGVAIIGGATGNTIGGTTAGCGQRDLRPTPAMAWMTSAPTPTWSPATGSAPTRSAPPLWPTRGDGVYVDMSSSVIDRRHVARRGQPDLRQRRQRRGDQRLRAAPSSRAT